MSEKYKTPANSMADPVFKRQLFCKTNKQKLMEQNVRFLKENGAYPENVPAFLELYCSVKISVLFLNRLCATALALNPFTAMISLDRMTNKGRNLKPNTLFCCPSPHCHVKGFLIKTHSADSGCVTGQEKIPFLRCVWAPFSLKILQAGAVKGFNGGCTHHNTTRC